MKEKLSSAQDAIKQFCLFCLNIERKTHTYYTSELVKRLCNAIDCPFWPDNNPLRHPLKAIKLKCKDCSPYGHESDGCFQCSIYEWLRLREKAG